MAYGTRAGMARIGHEGGNGKRAAGVVAAWCVASSATATCLARLISVCHLSFRMPLLSQHLSASTVALSARNNIMRTPVSVAVV